jgi:hypothetical protein
LPTITTYENRYSISGCYPHFRTLYFQFFLFFNPQNDIQPSASPNPKDISNTSIPFVPDRVQIILRNETSENSASSTQILGLYGNAISAAGAIAGINAIYLN